MSPRVPRAPSWNGYGWDLEIGHNDDILQTCDGADGSAPDGTSAIDESFACIEGFDSDSDPGAFSNIDEIIEGTQPGWTVGPNNTVFTVSGSTDSQLRQLASNRTTRPAPAAPVAWVALAAWVAPVELAAPRAPAELAAPRAPVELPAPAARGAANVTPATTGFPPAR